MKRSEFLLGLLTTTTLAGCGDSTRVRKLRRYDGPQVTRVLVYKERRSMYLLHNRQVLKKYRIRLGFAPLGHKNFEGDGKTPEGDYLIDRKNPNSDFHLSVGISYPDSNDVAAAQALGRSPGGDIFIHGGPRRGSNSDSESDWTWGCIALSDEEIEEVYAMVDVGTVISLYP